MAKNYRRPGKVKISWLPGHEPPPPAPDPQHAPVTKYPFAATINGRRAIVWPDWIEYEEG